MNELTGLLDAILNGHLQWRAPLWLWGIWLPVGFVIVARWLVKKNKQGYADAHLWPWVQVQTASSNAKLNRPGTLKKGSLLQGLNTGIRFLLRFNRFITPLRLVAIAWICLMIAIAGPRSVQTSEMQPTRNGVDILVVMDLSHSMTATDVFPNRFLQAKTLVESLKTRLQVDDRLALMGFAGQPHLISPLSFDRGLFQHNLDLIEPNILPMQGSWLELALIAGTQHLHDTAGNAKVMVVLTNGNPLFWQPPPLPKVFAQSPFSNDLRLSQTGVKTILVGIGQPTPSSLPDKTHKSGKLHASGLLVQSRLETMSLKNWAQNLQGTYLHGRDNGEFLEQLVQAVTLPAGERLVSDHQPIWQDFAPLFIGLALLALFLAFYPVALLSQKIAHTADSNKVSSPNLIGGLLMFLFFLGALFTMDSVYANSASTPSNIALEQQAFKAYQNQNYETATALYDQLNTYSGWMGAGSAAYKADDLESAVLYFRQAAVIAQQESLRAKALFNLGNSYYLANLLPQAIASFQQALVYQTVYPPAQHNLALAKARLKIEQANQKTGKGDEKNGDDAGKGREDEGAFYGGQKPNASSEEAGFGADGDALGGERSGNEVLLPLEGELTDYELQRDANARLNSEARASMATANAIVNREKQLQRAHVFQQQLEQIDDQQKTLLKRLFEREAGFQAAQDAPHPISGVQPW